LEARFCRKLAVHNGVDTERFAPGVRRDDARAARSSLNIGEGELVAAFVGSEWDRKGLEPAIRALGLDRRWALVVAGEGDRARYQALADSLGVGGAVRWLGVTPDVQLVYALADAFLLASSYETFSLVTFEAAASGLPILATPVSGVSELIDDGQNGFLIDRSPETIAARLQELAGDPALRARLGQAARQSALRFGWREMVMRQHELNERLAGARVG
jgi:glycosyltransferase involved in cell wall biosynthesis